MIVIDKKLTQRLILSTLRDEDVYFDLFLHAEDDESRTEDPTETKKRKAREEEGQVFLSQELPQATILISVMLSLFFLSTYYMNGIIEYLSFNFVNQDLITVDANSISTIIKDNIIFFLKLFLPIGFIVLFLVVFTTLIQTRFFFSTKNLKFNFKKIIPSWKNFLEKTIFSRTQIINAVKIIFKLMVSVVIVSFFIYLYSKDFVYLLYHDIFTAFKQSGRYIYEISLYLGVFLLVIAYPDWLIQRSEFIRKLRMTVDEVRRETKEQEGDPLIKQKQRERAKQIASKEITQGVKKADVVITNPTHYACAIEYNELIMDAPKLVSKGIDHLAFRIRKIAKENDIPIIENKPLARAIYDQVEINDYIPREFYSALAKILSQIDKYQRN